MTIWNDLKRPVNIISLSIGLLSIIVSLFLYFASLKSRNPVFLIDNQRGKIFDSKISSPAIKVLDKSSHAIDEDIYLVTLTFWNSGKLPIEPEHIRKPVRIKISHIKRLLDFTILKQTDPNISKIKLQEVTPSELELTWEHLDPGYGARIQLIYVGDKDAPISFDGKILDANITNVQPLAKKYKFIEGILSFLLGVLMAFISGDIKNIYRSVKNSNKSKAIIRIIITVVLTLTFILLFTYILKEPSPPV